MSITWADVLQMVRDRIGDDPTTPGTPYYKTEYIYRVISERLRSQGGMIARLAPNFYMSEADYTSVADQSDYDWPDDFGVFVKLEQKFGTGSTAMYLEVTDVSSEDQSTPGPSSFRPILSLPGSISLARKTVSPWKDWFRLDPIPTDTSETYRLKYLRKPVAEEDFADDDADVDVPESWTSFIASDAAVVIGKRKGDGRVPVWESERAQELDTLKKHFRRMKMNTQGFGPLEVM